MTTSQTGFLLKMEDQKMHFKVYLRFGVIAGSFQGLLAVRVSWDLVLYSYASLLLCPPSPLLSFLLLPADASTERLSPAVARPRHDGQFGLVRFLLWFWCGSVLVRLGSVLVVVLVRFGPGSAWFGSCCGSGSVLVRLGSVLVVLVRFGSGSAWFGSCCGSGSVRFWFGLVRFLLWFWFGSVLVRLGSVLVVVRLGSVLVVVLVRFGSGSAWFGSCCGSGSVRFWFGLVRFLL